jgi:hypothetical protein
VRATGGALCERLPPVGRVAGLVDRRDPEYYLPMSMIIDNPAAELSKLTTRIHAIRDSL